MTKTVLEVGRGQRPYGTGVTRGWGRIEKYYRIAEDTPRETNYLCSTCGANVFRVPSSTPFMCTLWICENGHKFKYENTD